jgi:GNAT superfamily N-acetyltransferase
MGIMNYFARWAYAPRFRMWWPLLKTQASPLFASFFEERFGLPGMEREDVGELSQHEGFAMGCWMLQGGCRPGTEKREGLNLGERLISYQLNLPHGRDPWFNVQAAQVIVRTRHLGTGWPLVWPDARGVNRRVVVWQADDFYVPPGLWGAGIGEDFLHLLTQNPYLGDKVGTPIGSLLAVRILVNQDAANARRKRWADEVHFYRAHGFTDPESGLATWLKRELDPELDRSPALSWRKGGEHWIPRWLVRSYWPSKPDDASRGSDSGPTPYREDEQGPSLLQ